MYLYRFSDISSWTNLENQSLLIEANAKMHLPLLQVGAARHRTCLCYDVCLLCLVQGLSDWRKDG